MRFEKGSEKDRQKQILQSVRLYQKDYGMCFNIHATGADVSVVLCSADYPDHTLVVKLVLV